MKTKKNSYLRNFCVAALVSLLTQCVWAATWTGDLAADAVTVSTQAQLSFESLLAAMPDAEANAYPMVQGVLGGTYVDGRPAVKGAVVVEKTADSVTLQLQVPQTHLKIVEVKLTAATDGGVQMTRLHRGYVDSNVSGLGTKVAFTNWDSQDVGVYQLKSFTVVLPKQDVTFTAANATDWNGKILPTVAKTVAATGNISFAGDTTYLQTLDSATGDTIASATVALVTGCAEAKVVYGLAAIGGDNNGIGTITRDVYLKVTGGTPSVISGGEDSLYNGSNKTKPTGNLLVNVGGTTTANHVVGAGNRGGTGSKITGHTGVVVEDTANIKGAIIGGWSSPHQAAPEVTGNTTVLIKNVQAVSETIANAPVSNTLPGWVIGGNAYLTNGGGGKVGGDSSVVIALDDDANGEFKKPIVGGSYKTTDNGANAAMTHTGSTSVTISAPNDVTFSGAIYGACYSGNGGKVASVGGNSSVTINGGTYTGAIYAGGNIATYTTVAGTATLTLQAGDFSGATLNGGQATGAKTLVAVGAVTLTPTQISGFNTIVAREGGALTLNVASDAAMSNIATEGTGYIVKAGAGTLDLGSLRPRMDVQAGKIKLLASGDDIAAGYINLPIPVTASEGDADKVLVVDANGETIQLNGTPVVDTTAGIVRINLQVNTVISTTGNLSASIQDSSSGLFLIQGPATGTPIEITIDCATPDAVTYQVSGLVKFILANGQSLMSLDKFAFEEGSELILDASCAGTITVPAGKAITIGGGTYTIVNNGTVSVKGDTTVSLTNNDTGVFDVVSGTATVNAPSNQAIKGTVYVRSGAIFTNARSTDAITYNGTVNVHVYGTLAFGSTRWTFGANSSLYLYTGATVTGAGEGGNGTLDFNGGNGNIFVKPNGSTTGTVTCSAPMRNRQGGTVNVDANMTFETTGNLINYSNGSPTKAGAGTWVVKGGTYSSGATVNAGTLKLVGITPGKTITVGDGTLELAQNENGDAFTFTGTVASSSLGKGAIKTAGSTVTLSGTFTNYSGDINSSAANSKFIIPDGQEVTVGWIVSGSAIEIEGMLVHTNKATNNYTNYQGQNLRNLTGHGTFKITGPHYFFTCGTSNLANYWASTLAVWNDRGDSTIANNKGIVFGQPDNSNSTITIGTLSGAGLIRSDANQGNRNIKVVQAKDSEWSGAFNGTDRVAAFIVAGAEGATAKTLTLSGTQTATNDLTIDASGSAKLTGTWKAGTVTVNGRLEVLDTATLEKTTLTSAGSMKTAVSTIYFGSDEIASAEAAAKAGTTYYATIADAVDAATLADITVINASAEVPAGYATVTTDGVVTLRQIGGKVYYKSGDWKDGCTVWADAGHTSTTTFNVADTMVLDTNNTVVYPNKDITSALKIEIAEGITAVIGHDNYLTANPYNVPDNSVITLGEGAHLGVTFWNNTTDYTPAFGTVTINGGTFGVYNVTSKAINAGTIKGTSQLVLNDGETITVSGSIETTPISGVATKRVVTTTVAGGTKYSLETIQPEPPTPTEGGITPNIPGADTIEIVDADGASVTTGKIPLTTGVYTVTGKVGDTVVATETLAVVKTKDAESGSSPDPVTTAVAVPFKCATVANLLNTALLNEGDVLKALNSAQEYYAWTLDANKKWQPISVTRESGTEQSPTADETELKRGAAVWVTTAGKVVAFGAYDSTAVEPEVVKGYNLIGNPKMTAITPEAKTVGDVLIPVGSTELVRYKVIEKAGGTKVWQCTKSVRDGVIPGTTIPAFGGDVSEEDPTVQVGGSVWLIK